MAAFEPPTGALFFLDNPMEKDKTTVNPLPKSLAGF